MNNRFDWVPFYEEMSSTLIGYRHRQQDLIAILQRSGVKGLSDQDPKKTKIPLKEIDPFTFQALLNKQSYAGRTAVLAGIKIGLNLNNHIPTDFSGIPKADPRQTWLFAYKFERKAGDINALWDLFETVQSKAGITEATFSNARAVKFAGKAKLTQAIFRAAPSRFFPIDGQTVSYLAGLRLPHDFKSAQEFQSISHSVSKLVAKPLFEQSYDAWLMNQKKPTNQEADYQTKVLKAARKKKHFTENPNGMPLPKIKKASISGTGFRRDPNVAAEALRKANFTCELNSAHRTFNSFATGSPYLEAHHLIPFGNQEAYPFSLDVTANIVALCPNCHRLLHHGKGKEKIDKIKILFQRREALLEQMKLAISIRELLQFYKGDLVDEEA